MEKIDSLSREKPRFLCFGEISWDIRWVVDHLPGSVTDCFAQEVSEGAGGCAANSALDLAAYGYRVDLFGNAIGGRDHGKNIPALMKQAGVHLLSGVHDSAVTPVCQVFVNAQGARCFVMDHRSIDQNTRGDTRQLKSALRDGLYQAAFIQCYPRTLAEDFLKDLQPSARTILMTQDLSPRDPLVPVFDIVQISLPEMQTRTSEEIDSLAQSYFRGRNHTVLVTHGSHGVWAVRRGQHPIHQPALSVEHVVDTTGCGDAFRAGFLASLASRSDLEDALVLGNQYGAAKCAIKGSHLFRNLNP